MHEFFKARLNQQPSQFWSHRSLKRGRRITCIYLWTSFYPIFPNKWIATIISLERLSQGSERGAEELSTCTEHLSVIKKCMHAQPCPTLCDRMDCSLPGSSVQSSKEEYKSDLTIAQELCPLVQTHEYEHWEKKQEISVIDLAYPQPIF